MKLYRSSSYHPITEGHHIKELEVPLELYAPLPKIIPFFVNFNQQIDNPTISTLDSALSGKTKRQLSSLACRCYSTWRFIEFTSSIRMKEYITLGNHFGDKPFLFITPVKETHCKIGSHTMDYANYTHVLIH
jgi:hypothetical protein